MLVKLWLTMGFLAASAPPASAGRVTGGTCGGEGRLMVAIAVDQLRYEDLLLLAPEFGQAGFAGLGRPFMMRYDTVGTETAAGHATLGTGAYASVHGVPANNYWDGTKEVSFAVDPNCPVWGRKEGRGPGALNAPTVADALAQASLGRARVVSVSGSANGGAGSSLTSEPASGAGSGCPAATSRARARIAYQPSGSLTTRSRPSVTSTCW